jgi:hypothetical protein
LIKDKTTLYCAITLEQAAEAINQPIVLPEDIIDIRQEGDRMIFSNEFAPVEKQFDMPVLQVLLDSFELLEQKHAEVRAAEAEQHDEIVEE